MIKNDRQYEYTKKKLHEFEKNVKEIQKKYARDKNKTALLSQGYIEHIAQLKAAIAEYKKIKAEPLPVKLTAHDPSEISRQLVRLRIKRKLTQAQLASRLGCQQADISRVERDDYEGYSYPFLKKIAKVLNANVEVNFIPAGRKIAHHR